MKRSSFRSINLIFVVLVVIGIIMVTQVQVMADYIQHALTWQTGPIATPRGPEADPRLRHAPGGYDYELESPPEELR